MLQKYEPKNHKLYRQTLEQAFNSKYFDSSTQSITIYPNTQIGI